MRRKLLVLSVAAIMAATMSFTGPAFALVISDGVTLPPDFGGIPDSGSGGATDSGSGGTTDSGSGGTTKKGGGGKGGTKPAHTKRIK
jgi:hypothetical protein